jgi:hypothetical protein
MSEDAVKSRISLDTGLRRWELRFFVAESYLLIAALSALAGVSLRRRGPLSHAAFFAVLILLVPLVLLPVQSVFARVRQRTGANVVWMIGVSVAAAIGVALFMILRG